MPLQCLLCRMITLEKNASAINEKQEDASTISDIIKQHFWFADRIFDAELEQRAHSVVVICKTCWGKLEDFHEFFVAVKFNHQISENPILPPPEEYNFHPEEHLTEHSTENKLEPVLVKYEFIHEDFEEEQFVSDVDYEDSMETFTESIEIEIQDQSPNSCLRRSSRQKLEHKYKPAVNKTKKPVQEKNSVKKTKGTFKMTEEENEEIKEYASMSCEECSQKIESWEEAKSHYRIHRKVGYIRCCGRKIDRACEMKDHLLWHKDRNAFQCLECGKVLLTREYLELHMGTHLAQEKRQIQCLQCPKKFANNFSLSMHKRLHKNDGLEPTIECPHCQKLYKTEPQLRAHIDCVHNPDAPRSFICEICSKELKSKYTLSIHVKSHTEPEMPITCNLCGHILKNKRRFAIHMSKHVKGSEAKCLKCPKIFKHRAAMLAHVSYVHSKKKFDCSYCSKVFKHKNVLIEHEATHLGINLYSCPFCERTFKSNANMHSHKKKAHPEEYAKLPPPSYKLCQGDI